jgi:DNA-directed RNA polymerase specialized sigma24 family protein
VRHNYSSDYAFIKWLFTISKSEVADYFKYKKSVFIQFNEEAISTISEFTPEIDIELDSLNNLSSNEKKALKLRYYSENDFQEISKALGTSKANARKIA